MTAKSVDADFVAATVEWRGASKELLVYSIPVLWYSIGRTNLVTPVIARHPTSTMHDDFFFPTDLDAGAPRVALQRVHRSAPVDRVRQPTGQAATRRRRPPMLEALRPRERCRAVAVTLRRTGQPPRTAKIHYGTV